jgi:cobaltochelatase CobS
MTNQEKIDQLNNIIATSTSQVAIDRAKKQLEALATQGQVKVLTNSLEPDVQAVIDALNRVVSGGGNASQSDIKRIVLEELVKRKITEQDLGADVLAMIQSSRKVELTIRTLTSQSSTTTDNAFLERPLIQRMLSDMLALNNVYLYGGAGTGKTFSAGGIAQILGWRLITLNCNQFTSPIDIIGGQTIDGYQEGKVSMAWSNIIVDNNGLPEKVDGVVLLLDELPKIDPNTAGLLNEALAKVKDYDKNPVTNQKDIPPTILNGRNQTLVKGNLMVIATGNVALNTVDPDYEANFKQDLSLLDRFIGSTYKVFIDYQYEFNNTMKGFAFIWIFCTKMREKIIELNATGQAFVSIRLMINMKQTYIVERQVKEDMANGKSTVVSSPKTLEDSLNTFLDLFKPSVKQSLISSLPIDEFKRTIQDKNKMPFNPQTPDFDTSTEIQEAQGLINAYNAKQQQLGI